MQQANNPSHESPQSLEKGHLPAAQFQPCLHLLLPEVKLPAKGAGPKQQRLLMWLQPLALRTRWKSLSAITCKHAAIVTKLFCPSIMSVALFNPWATLPGRLFTKTCCSFVAVSCYQHAIFVHAFAYEPQLHTRNTMKVSSKSTSCLNRRQPVLKAEMY